RAVQDVDWRETVFVLVRWIAPGEGRRPHAEERLEQRHAGLDRPERAPVRDVDLAPAARRAHVLVKGRFEQRRTEEDARQVVSVHPRGKRFGIHPRRTHELEWLRRAPTLRDVRALE